MSRWYPLILALLLYRRVEDLEAFWRLYDLIPRYRYPAYTRLEAWGLQYLR